VRPPERRCDQHGCDPVPTRADEHHAAHNLEVVGSNPTPATKLCVNRRVNPPVQDKAGWWGIEDLDLRREQEWMAPRETVAHNPKVAGSNPAPATGEGPGQSTWAFVIAGSRHRRRLPARSCASR